MQPQVEDFLRSRSHFAHITPFSIDSAIKLVEDELNAKKLILPDQKSFGTANTALSVNAQNQVQLVQMYVEDLATALYGFPRHQVNIKDMEIMRNGATRPVKAFVELNANHDKPLQRVMYVKAFDPTRVFGLELYSLISSLTEDYRFSTTDNDVVENSLDGDHAYDLSAAEVVRRKANHNFLLDRINCDLLLFYAGIDDVFGDKNSRFMGKEDNYLITTDGRIKIIDLDSITSAVSANDEEILARKNFTSAELSISRDEYDRIFAQQKERLKAAVYANKLVLDSLFFIYSTADMLTRKLTNDIKGKLYTLL